VRAGDVVTVRGCVLARDLRRLRGGQTIFEAAIGDTTGVLHSLWFNQPYLAQQLKKGDELVLYGRIESSGSRPQMVHPEMERVEGEDEASLHMGRIVPIYPLVSGVSQRWLRQVIAGVLERFSGALDDPLPEPLRRAKGWPGVAEAVREIHFPTSWESLKTAQERLAFEELFVLQAALAQRRARAVATRKPQRYQREGALVHAVRQRLPFSLTTSQQRALEEILTDLCCPSPMSRLLQGDVGCGKTVVLAVVMAVAVQSGYQVALMAPTELLATQHAHVMTQYLGPLGVSVGLLSQGVKAEQRRRRQDDVARGALDVVIGTHALIQAPLTFRRLSLVIIDEQHKFGVAQRAHLAKKAEAPDVLVLTATPIPRTLALSLYGDLAVSTITELPPGRRPIDTRWMGEAQRQELYAMVRQQLAQGRQGYIVYPLVEPSSAEEVSAGEAEAPPTPSIHLQRVRMRSDLRAATQMARHLQEEVFPEFRVGLLHGQMSSRDKEQTMQAFAGGALQLLVSTVIVEVGLDVTNATIMVIEHPERFGLAQLHQLRGRIGRGTHPAACVVVSDATDEAARRRLTTFVQTTDGFELAERDLEQRGPGALFGGRQHGEVRLRIASLLRDRALLELARREATTLMARDRELRGPSAAALRRRLARFRQQLG